MTFQISALKAEQFSHLFGLDDTALRAMGITPMTADAMPGFPCRVSLEDAPIGSRVLLLKSSMSGAISTRACAR